MVFKWLQISWGKILDDQDYSHPAIASQET